MNVGLLQVSLFFSLLFFALASDFFFSLLFLALQDAPNPHAVASSKAIGEPPLFLGCSVFLAVKNAIYSARGDGKHFPLHSPATPEKIRMACCDWLSGVDRDYEPKLSC